MAKLKTLLFRQEIKNRRVSKIKSKLFHKLKKKDREREEEKLKQYMMEVDPEAAKAYQEKVELKQVEERLRMRHGTGTKYAKNLKRFRNMDDQETKDAFHQTVLDRQALTKRTERVGSESESDSSGSDEDMSDEEMKSKAIGEMKELVDSSSEGGEESSEEESDEIVMDFST